MRELLQDAVSMYVKYRGNGRLVPLVLVALLLCFIMIIKSEKGRRINPAVFLLYIWAGVAYVLSTIISDTGHYICNKNCDIDGNEKEESKTETYINKALPYIAFLIIVFALSITGNRILSSEYFVKADNNLHIRQEYVDVMERILLDSDNPSVIAPYEISPYFSMYSAKFNMLYDYPKDADLNSLNRDAREAYDELFGYEPDTYKLSQIAKKNGMEYVVMSSGRHYPEFPITEYGFMQLDAVGDYIIYKISEVQNEKD